mmetsp:Transcript_62855/g.72136  ORF Transcript_62855/g.72136 Transcript_62855/m.72136 type:complete len:179 (-) Transcript_62855:33-569(-)
MEEGRDNKTQQRAGETHMSNLEVYRILLTEMKNPRNELKVDDLVELTMKISKGLHEDEAAEQRMKKMLRDSFREITAGSNYIKEEDFVRAMDEIERKTTPSNTWNEKLLKRIFDEHDANRDGSLELSEYQEMLKKFGFEADEEEMESLFRQILRTNNIKHKKISFKDFKSFITGKTHL